MLMRNRTVVSVDSVIVASVSQVVFDERDFCACATLSILSLAMRYSAYVINLDPYDSYRVHIFLFFSGSMAVTPGYTNMNQNFKNVQHSLIFSPLALDVIPKYAKEKMQFLKVQGQEILSNILVLYSTAIIGVPTVGEE